MEINIWHVRVMAVCAGFGFCLAVEDDDTAENAILGPVPNNIGDLFRVDIVGEIAGVVENCWGSYQDVSRGLFFPVWDPTDHTINVAFMEPEVHLEYCSGQLVDRDSD